MSTYIAPHFIEWLKEVFGDGWDKEEYGPYSMEFAYNKGREDSAEMSELERAVVDAAMAWFDRAHIPGVGSMEMHDACAALAAHRSPPKVDRVREALRLVQSLDKQPCPDWRDLALEQAEQLLTAELEARKEAK